MMITNLQFFHDLVVGIIPYLYLYIDIKNNCQSDASTVSDVRLSFLSNLSLTLSKRHFLSPSLDRHESIYLVIVNSTDPLFVSLD